MRLFIPIFLIIVSVVLTFFYTMPAYDNVNLKLAEKGDLDTVLNNSRAVLQEISTKQAEYNSFPQDKKDKLNELISENIDNVKIIMNLNNIATIHGMSIRNITMKTGDKAPAGGAVGPNTKEYNTATIGFTVSAPYEKFRAFLKDLEISLPLIDISALNFTSGEKNIYDFNIEVKTYWLKSAISNGLK